MKVSIIIPLYNLGKLGDYCLVKCLDSIKSQTYADFEVLLMENGSQDDTIIIANKYIKQDKRFKLFILNEKGIANARNEGLKAAKSKYVTFIDGDDYISNDYIESLVTAMEQDNNIDLSIVPCKLDYVKTGKQKIMPIDYTPRILKGRQIIEIFSDGTVWAKLYKSEIIHKYDITFDKELFGVDDTPFIAEYRILCNKIAVTNKGCYYYIQDRMGQTTKDKMETMIESAILLNKKLYGIFKKYNMEEVYKGYIDLELLNFFIGKHFASTSLAKLPVNRIDKIISSYKDRILNTIPNKDYCPDWQILWFNRFKYMVKNGYGAMFIKFIRLYRNIILQPLGISYKYKINTNNRNLNEK